MKNLILSVIFLFSISATLFSCTTDDSLDEGTEQGTGLPLEASSVFNISYGDQAQQIYDLYLPADRSVDKTKVIVLIHGGGWTSGDKDDMLDFVSFIKQQHPNHAIVNINYVLAGINPVTPAFPNQFLDVKSVIEKITAESESLQILPEFGLIGTSAGAHLAMMYDYVYDTLDQVRFVANIVGPTDFTDPFFAENKDFATSLALLVDESKYPAGTDYAMATSPTHNVSSNSSPTVMFYGNEDPLVPLSNGSTINSALSNAQVTHSFTIYDGGHGDDGSPTDLLNLQSQIGEYIIDYLPIQ